MELLSGISPQVAGMCCAQAFTDIRMLQWYRGTGKYTAAAPSWAKELTNQLKSSFPNAVQPYLAARGWKLTSSKTYRDLAHAYASGLQWTAWMGPSKEINANVEEVIAHEQFIVAMSQ